MTKNAMYSDNATVRGTGSNRPAARSRVLIGIAALAVAGAAVAGVSVAGATSAKSQTRTGAVAGLAVAKGSLTSSGTAAAKQRIGSLPDGKRIAISGDTWFETRGTKWAVTTQVPGQPEIQPFEWRATVGNSNLGNPVNHPNLIANGLVFVTVFKSDNADRVVYTIGGKSHEAKLYRLTGIPGWVAATLDLSKTPPAYDRHGKIQGMRAVAVYDRAGKILGQLASPK